MKINSVPQSECIIMAIQGHGAQPVNQSQTVTTSRLNWKAKCTCYACGKKGYLVTECTQTGNSTISHNLPTLHVNTLQTSSAKPILFSEVNPTILQAITTENTISAITSNLPTLHVNTPQTSSAEPILFSEMNPTILQAITAETTISAQI